MSKIKRLPDAELEIMNALWDADAPLTAAELETALPGPPRARTTLLTLLARGDDAREALTALAEYLENLQD